jgi:hypothetical protein
MDIHAISPITDPGRVLDPLLRRVGDENQSRRRPALHLTPRRAHEVHLHFPMWNNMAEYEDLLCGLRITIETSIKRLDIRGTRSS